MKEVLIAYFSLTGKTEMMAQYVAEGVRFSVNEDCHQDNQAQNNIRSHSLQHTTLGVLPYTPYAQAE